jgi:3-deoxy-manno-octulosonate cytidylyltransferase (CMP-KDO synthetase)
MTHIFIPARLNSSRFPNKVLYDFCGKSMLQRVYERAASLGFPVTVATEDDVIVQHVQSWSGTVVKTSVHPNGTARLAEAVVQCGLPDDAVVINIQADEPLFDIDGIWHMVRMPCIMGTLAIPIQDLQGVRVLVNQHHCALYFTRQPIVLPNVPIYQHVGVYRYTVEHLKRYAYLQPSPFEVAESLEQLRWLDYGFPIMVNVLDQWHGISVDLPEHASLVLQSLNVV